MRAHSPTLFLNIIWNQHQPLYLDPERDELQAPWVRTHATKDYYDMAALVAEYPGVHCTFNLTSSLLIQLEEYYVRRLSPFLDKKKNRIDARAFFTKWKGKTDPWIDLALTPTSEFSDRDRHLLLRDTWNALFISDVMIARFPEYRLLKDKAGRNETLSEQEMRDVKFWFFLAYFDPDFLERRVILVDRSVVDLSDLIYKHYDGTYRLKKIVTEDDCNRIIAEAVKIFRNIVPVHRKLLYDPVSHKGQIDVITTAFYHPILPLIYDSTVAKICQPESPLPQRRVSRRPCPDVEGCCLLQEVVRQNPFGHVARGRLGLAGGAQRVCRGRDILDSGR
jgi:alpha-amylase/alpha-mannosidase (GH57 family)